MKLFLLFCLFTSVLGCGIHLKKPHSRHERAIIGGKHVKNAKKWPWQVLLVFEDGVCGGNVIGNRWILTAAHCVWNTSISDIDVYDGITRIQRANNDYVRTVLDAVIHPYYDHGDEFYNDIAVLKLAEPLEYDHLVSPICLPNPHQSIPDDGQAVITGFGNTDVEINGTIGVAFDGQLREAIVPIVNPELCKELWQTGTNSTVGADKEEEEDERKAYRVICASSFAHGTHKGDSGGPLMMSASSGRWFQIGITSFSQCEAEECDAPDDMRGDLFPNMFTDVRQYCDWITENTEGEVNCYKREVILEDVEIKA